MRSINDPRQTGKPVHALRQPERTIIAPAEVHSRALVEPFKFGNCCTMPAAVTKSLLDRSFSSRFESWRSEKIFIEDFHQDNFFVLVCGPFLLIENFLAPAKPPRSPKVAALENERFHTAII
jgi:hypothetical protein